MMNFARQEFENYLKRVQGDREDENKIAQKYGLNTVTLMLNLTVPLDNKWYYHDPNDDGNGGDENPEKAGKFGTYRVWDRAGGYDKKLSKEEADLWYLWGGGEAIYVNNSYINWDGLTIPKGLKRGDIFAIGTAEAFMKLPYETAATYGGTSFEVIDNNTVKVLDQEYHYRYRDNNSISNIMRNFMTWWGAPSYIPQGQPYMIHYYNRKIKIK